MNLIIGADLSLTDSILVRFEAQPGLYGTFFNHITSGDFDVPFVLGGSYLYSDSLQFFVGVGVDVNRKYPVIPGVGFRYKVAPKLVLNIQLPAPRVEYELSKKHHGLRRGRSSRKITSVWTNTSATTTSTTATTNGCSTTRW